MKFHLGRKKKIGLALGGGAARGWAHLGVIQALQERGVTVDFVAGTSMGALVGGFFAAGRLPVLRELAVQLDWKQVLYYFFEMSFSRSGLVDGRKIVEWIRRNVPVHGLAELPLPFRAVATDVLSGREVVIAEGDLIDAIRASIAIPGLFTPVNRGGMVLVDGGLTNPVPVSVAREMGAEKVIAVDLNYDLIGSRQRRRNVRLDETAASAEPDAPDPLARMAPMLEKINASFRRLNLPPLPVKRRPASGAALPGIADVLGNSIRIAEAQITATRLKIDPPDVLIRPEVGGIMIMDFHRAQEAIAAGYTAAVKALG